VNDSLRYSLAMHLSPVGVDGRGQFDFQTIADPGTYLIEASTNLVDWMAVTNVTIINNSAAIIDGGSVGFRSRFYRMRTTP
jgi:hypothetical protein